MVSLQSLTYTHETSKVNANLNANRKGTDTLINEAQQRRSSEKAGVLGAASQPAEAGAGGLESEQGESHKTQGPLAQEHQLLRPGAGCIAGAWCG